jgi:hypothetical protein
MSEQTLTPALQRYGEQLVTLGDQTLTLHEWCVNRNISIVSVKRRRDRFCSWADSLAPLDVNHVQRKKIITHTFYGKCKHMNKPTKPDTSAEVTIGGVTKTARQWATDMGLNWSTVSKRHQLGETWVEALRPNRKSAAADTTNPAPFSAASVNRTVGRKPIDEMAEPPIADQIKTITVTVGNETKTVEEWMAINGVSLAILRARRKRGATWLEAIRSLKEAKEARHQTHHRSALVATLDNESRRIQQAVIPEK